MQKSFSESYKNAGVDITAGYEAVQRMQKHVKRTNIKGVLSGIGGFGGLFMPDFSGYKQPVLVSGTDGVGTKLALAFLMDKHNTIGIDCVAMCVNDIVCSGAKPLFFLDYIACGKNNPQRIEGIVEGVAEGCVQAGCALIGGETAEMPGMYKENEYDIAGFALGAVDKEKMLNPENVQAGDIIIALQSSGVHSNGFSLVRKVFNLEKELQSFEKELSVPLGEALLKPTKIYVEPILKLISKIKVNSICHITGGGFYENLPRALPQGFSAKIDVNSLYIPPIFKLIEEKGEVPTRDMFNTFNMGVGMCVILPKENAADAIEILQKAGENAYIIGQVVQGENEVIM